MTADGLFAFVRSGSGRGGGSSSSCPSAITRRATLLVESMPTRLSDVNFIDVKLEREKRKKEKKEKKKEEKEKKKEKR